MRTFYYLSFAILFNITPLPVNAQVAECSSYTKEKHIEASEYCQTLNLGDDINKNISCLKEKKPELAKCFDVIVKSCEITDEDCFNQKTLSKEKYEEEVIKSKIMKGIIALNSYSSLIESTYIFERKNELKYMKPISKESLERHNEISSINVFVGDSANFKTNKPTTIIAKYQNIGNGFDGKCLYFVANDGESPISLANRAFFDKAIDNGKYFKFQCMNSKVGGIKTEFLPTMCKDGSKIMDKVILPACK